MSFRDTMMVNSNFCLPLDELITSRNTGFGDGHHGVVVYDNFFPLVKSASLASRYEIHSTYFELPIGRTLKPPLNSGGLVIYSLSDIVINGTIDMKFRGYYNEDKDAPKTVLLYGREYILAIGGGTVAAAKGGYGGNLYRNSSNCKGGDPKIQSGNLQGIVSSGGWSMANCGLGGYSYANNYNPGGTLNVSKEDLNYAPTGTVLLIARGKIIIKGKIDCSATPGTPAESGTVGYPDPGLMNLYAIRGGRGGYGAQAPSGGGAITLIAKEIDRAGGILDVKGKTYINTTPGNAAATITVTHPNSSSVTGTAYGGYGGMGTPPEGFTSQAGNIKEYIYTNQGV